MGRETATRPTPRTSGPGELETEASYGDFVMQLDCFVDGDGLNSGVFFRSIPGEFANGYESQINNAREERRPDASPSTPAPAPSTAEPRPAASCPKTTSGSRKTIVATGPHIAVWVNGYQVTDWTDDRPPRRQPPQGPPPRPRHDQPPSPRPHHQPPLPQPPHRRTPEAH